MLLLTARTASSVVAQNPFSTPLGRVLVLYSDERLLPANIILDEAIRTTFAADTSDRIEFHSEFLDVTRFPGEAQQQRQRDFLRDKYRERPPDVVIAVGGAALEFLLNYRAELFTGVPIVQCSMAGDPHPKNLQDAKIAGIAVPKSASSTLEIAFRLHPDTRQVAVVSGNGPRDRKMTDEMRGEIDTFQNRAAIMWLSNLSLQELRGELSRLPDHTVVLYLTMFQDASGASFTPRQALDQFATASRAPIYGFYDTYLGHGIVGGSMVTFEEIGRKAAQLGIRMLADDEAQTAVRLESPKAKPMFDWHELRRWNISEKQLPPGSAVRFKETTYWEQHYRLILVAGSLCALEALLITTLLVQLRRRRLAERSLRESEERMSLAADAANVGIWIRDLMGQEIWATDKWRELFGFEKVERLDMHSFLKRLHSGDRDAVSQTLASAEERGGTYEMEYRIVLPDGRVRWISSQGRVEFDDVGKPLLMRGVSLDNTARKQAEHALHERRGELAHLARVTMIGELSGSLAHELNQPLTAILSNAQAAEHYLAQDAPDLAQVREILADIVAEDQRAGEVIRRLRLLLSKGEVQQQTLDVNEVVIEVLKLARSDLTSHGVTVDTALASELGAIRGDGVQLQQVLLNLVMNACDAMADNVAKDRLLTVRTFSAGEASVRIEVSDIGRGLPAGGAERVFERYFTTKTQSLGLGLSVCRTIITAHGGTLGAANNAGRGATFHFTLPLAKKPRA